MKFLFVLLLISISTITLCQTHNAKFYLKPIVGVNLHSDQLETIAANKPIKVLNSGLLGLEVGHKKSPFILRYQHLQYMSLQVNSDSIFLGNNNIGEIWLNDEIGLFYRFKKTTFGLSHYWKKRENWITHNFLLVRDFINKGFNLSVSYPVEWFDVELRAQVQYYDVFAALVGSANYSLSFLYKFDKASKQAHQSNFVHLNALVGVRLFPHNVKPSGNEFFVKSFGIAPQLGLEFLFDKYNVSFNLEKDWWLSFNAGSQIRDVKGLVYNTFVGIKYHQKLKIYDI